MQTTILGGLAAVALGFALPQTPSQAPPAGAKTAPDASEDVRARTVTCIIGPRRFKGPCQFDAMGRGSFSLSLDDGAALYDDVTEIMVFVFAPGQADVRTRRIGGGSERLGEARRMEDYPACWLGAAGWSVCAY